MKSGGARRPSLGDRWWFWTQQHPLVQVLAIVALLLVFVIIVAVGDYVLTSTCVRATNLGVMNCLSYGGH